MLFSLLNSGISDPKEIAFVIIMYFLALSLAFAGHEFAHAFSAHLLGDDTAKNLGRMTLNPLAHIDLKGMIFLILLGFGWGKPVPVNPGNYDKLKSKKLSNVIVDLSGVFANFIMALIAAIVYVLIAALTDHSIIWFSLIRQFLSIFHAINLTLLGFNLIPIPPLDGFNFWVGVLPVRFRYSNFFRKYVQFAPMILFGLIILGMLIRLSALSLIIEFISWPFEKVIELICSLILMLIN
ncbi:MAG: site-2 protease family protein [Clostridia bacterium]|nr:site-2 protease family protein [Clostridia bacterium]